jgi:hypothetical protein
MANLHQVVTCFVIYSGKQIVAQGSFQVFDTRNLSIFTSSDGIAFQFEHVYEKSVCVIDISCKRDGVIALSRSLKIPINRSKIKWKVTELGTFYRLHYRSQFETTSDRELRRPSSLTTRGPDVAPPADDA